MIKINDNNYDKLYIRFGDIPKKEESGSYKSGELVDKESGVSVWDARKANGIYHPILPKDPNKDAISDYFKLLLGDRPVYVLKGVELLDKGTDGEPLLKDIEIVEEYGESFYKNKYS